MKKRKINQEYLRCITSQEIPSERIYAKQLADVIEDMASDELEGILRIKRIGYSDGCVRVKPAPTAYLIRLLCESQDNDEPIDLTLRLGDDFTIEFTLGQGVALEDVVYFIKMASLAGFKVSRVKNTFTFKAEIFSPSPLKVYACQAGDLRKIFKTAFEM